MGDLIQIANSFEERLGKSAARGKSNKSSRKQILKKIDKSTSAYKSERKKLNSLQKQKEKLESEISESQAKLSDSRNDMLKLKSVLRNMDLADCNHAVLYESSNDCGYIIDGEEYHLDVGEDGELEQVLMKDYKKRKREENKSSDDFDADDSDMDEEEDSEDTNDADDLFFPNLRLSE